MTARTRAQAQPPTEAPPVDETPKAEPETGSPDWDAIRAEQRRQLDAQEIDNARRIAGLDKNEDEG